MPKTPARDDYFAQSFRFTPEQAATIKEEAKLLGSTTAFVRELIDDLPHYVRPAANPGESLGSRHEEPENSDTPRIHSPFTRAQISDALGAKTSNWEIRQALTSEHLSRSR